MPLLYQYRIYRQDLRANPQVLYVFGDNLVRVGLGGQAQEMRGELNAVGLPTKRSPAEFLTDRDLDEVKLASHDQILRVHTHLAQGGTVVWPHDGVGTGLAQLPQRAPEVARFWDQMRGDLESRYGGGNIAK